MQPIFQTTLKRWIQQYNYNGINGLAVPDKNQKYTVEFKSAVVQAVKNGQFSAEYACPNLTAPVAVFFCLPHCNNTK